MNALGKLDAARERDTELRIAIDAADRLRFVRFSLLVMSEHGTFTYPLPDEGVVRIGRAAACEVSIDDGQLSREHARLVLGATIAIEDLASSNGTRLGTQALVPHRPTPLPAGEHVSMGATVLVLQHAAAEARSRPRHDDDAPEVTPGGALDRLRALAERFAEGSIPVLVLGETGVGKDVLASMIHRASRRAGEPYVCINCGALPETLLESELFGHERGAFTGANTASAGLLESARAGTVLLDEVAELPLAAQASLLRVLDQGEVLRLGATRPRPIDARFIAATNRDLELEVERGRFRQDLYFRLAGATIVIPPLRERVGEIAPLALRFVRDVCRERAQARVPRILPDAMEALERHTWPGNVRELRNAIERAVLLARENDIGLTHLPLERMGRRLSTAGRASPPSRPLYVSARAGELVARDPEAAKLLAALDACGWNQTRTAAMLGVSLRTLVSRLGACGLTRKRAR